MSPKKLNHKAKETRRSFNEIIMKRKNTRQSKSATKGISILDGAMYGWICDSDNEIDSTLRV